MDLRTVVANIPPTAWAALIGSAAGAILSLPGILLSLRHSRKLQSRQLAHDTGERTRERQMAWRREVYLEAIESISRINGLLGGVADLNIPEMEIAAVRQTEFAKVSRIRLVASDATVVAVDRFLTQFSELYMPLALTRAQLLALQEELRSAEPMRQREMEALARDWSLLAQIDANAKCDPALRNVVAADIKVRGAMVEHFQRRRLELFEQIPTAQSQLMKESIAAVFSLSPLIDPALFAAREELGIPLDVAAYTKHSSELLARMKEATGSMSKSVDKLLSSQQGEG